MNRLNIIIVWFFSLTSMDVLGGKKGRLCDLSEDERCAEDGVYIGCYNYKCFFKEPQNRSKAAVTPDSCTKTCKSEGFPVAALFNRTECSCSCQGECLSHPLDDAKCGLPCNLTRFCGGFNAAAVYIVRPSNNIACEKLIDQPPTISRDKNDSAEIHPVIPIFTPLLCVMVVVNVVAVLIHRCFFKINTKSSSSADTGGDHSTQNKSTQVNFLRNPIGHSILKAPTGDAILKRLACSTAEGICTEAHFDQTTVASSTGQAKLEILKTEVPANVTGVGSKAPCGEHSSAKASDREYTAVIKVTDETQGSSTLVDAEEFYSEAHYGENSFASSLNQTGLETADDAYVLPEQDHPGCILPEPMLSQLKRSVKASRIRREYFPPELPLLIMTPSAPFDVVNEQQNNSTQNGAYIEFE